MPRLALSALLCLCCLLSTLPARAALDDQQRALQQLQVQACRVVGSLLLLRGEGFQEQHAAQLEKDLASLDRALAAAPRECSCGRAKRPWWRVSEKARPTVPAKRTCPGATRSN
ncbi:Uncharacterised protein [Pseudomonas aeruginosa]|nr:Uncharacterised protein [Pseudomonas aeruginosa]